MWKSVQLREKSLTPNISQLDPDNRASEPRKLSAKLNAQCWRPIYGWDFLKALFPRHILPFNPTMLLPPRLFVNPVRQKIPSTPINWERTGKRLSALPGDFRREISPHQTNQRTSEPINICITIRHYMAYLTFRLRVFNTNMSSL